MESGLLVASQYLRIFHFATILPSETEVSKGGPHLIVRSPPCLGADVPIEEAHEFDDGYVAFTFAAEGLPACVSGRALAFALEQFRVRISGNVVAAASVQAAFQRCQRSQMAGNNFSFVLLVAQSDIRRATRHFVILLIRTRSPVHEAALALSVHSHISCE